MNKAELVAAFRRAADDRSAGYLFSDADVLDWLREAEDEAAMRKRLLFESVRPEMCEVPIEAGQQTYTLHPRWFVVTHASWANDGEAARYRRDMVTGSRDAMDRGRYRNWRSSDSLPFALVFDAGFFTVAGQVQRAGTVYMEGYRLPMEPLADADDAEPEIHAIHHRHLVDWALYRAYQIPDAETLYPGGAAAALDRFERHFGLRVDADLLRDAQADQQHSNRCW